MKTINSYILERLNPRHLGSHSLSEFPLSSSAEVIVRFLKEKGFVEIPWVNPLLFESGVKPAFEDASGRSFMWFEDSNVFDIRFADTTSEPITNNNSIYLCYRDKRHANRSVEFYKETDYVFQTRLTKDKFLKEIEQFK
jgi:hypothetical protein